MNTGRGVQPTIAPFGSWRSPLTAALASGASVSLSAATAHRGQLYWIEGRPAEEGRNVMVTLGEAGPREVTPPAFNVRTRVHEYGGLAYVLAGDRVVFSQYADQRLYVQEAGAPPRALTPTGYRYADGAASPDGRTVYCVREDHTQPGEAKSTLVALDLDTASAGRVLFGESDFVAYPRPSPDGRRLALLSWNHPNMPWSGTTLRVGSLVDGALVALEVIAGGESESVLEPRWDRDGSLYFLSDRTGWWNLFRHRDGRTEAVTALEAEIGGPLWQLGASHYALTDDGHAVVQVCRRAVDGLAVVDLASGRLRTLDLPFVEFSSIGVRDAGTAFAVATAVDALPELITIDLASGRHTAVRTAGTTPLSPAFVSHPEPIEFPTRPGHDGAPRSAHAFFFPPCNPDYSGPTGATPPLIVILHGGPTGHSTPALRVGIQFWTTRGIAVVNVNYGGSTGHGRPYRDRLLGQWGVVDLNDAIAAVDHLAAGGRVDPGRVAIRGGSAGGYTVLAALAFSDRFAAGINYFGVGDLELLAADTHKFESRYLDLLIAPLPEGRALYRARSPIHHLQRMNSSLITFQGSEDRAVPPAQSRMIVEAVRAQGRPVAYIEFEGEQHGFRRAENIARALEAELYFLGKVFGFEPADAIEPVEISACPEPQ